VTRKTNPMRSLDRGLSVPWNRFAKQTPWSRLVKPSPFRTNVLQTRTRKDIAIRKSPRSPLVTSELCKSILCRCGNLAYAKGIGLGPSPLFTTGAGSARAQIHAGALYFQGIISNETPNRLRASGSSKFMCA
jgi:hypothetical protein